MNSAEAILRDVLVELRQGPNGLYFVSPPNFVEQRIESLETVAEQRAAVASLSSLGFTLAREQQSPLASKELMTCVDRVTKKLQSEGAPK
jgi:hypothetical protein